MADDRVTPSRRRPQGASGSNSTPNTAPRNLPRPLCPMIHSTREGTKSLISSFLGEALQQAPQRRLTATAASNFVNVKLEPSRSVVLLHLGLGSQFFHTDHTPQAALVPRALFRRFSSSNRSRTRKVLHALTWLQRAFVVIVILQLPHHGRSGRLAKAFSHTPDKFGHAQWIWKMMWMLHVDTTARLRTRPCHSSWWKTDLC